jgi:hypothetical protein
MFGTSERCSPRHIAGGVLQATERLRRIFGSVHENELGWRLIHNEELYEPLNQPSVVKYIKFKRLQGRGCIV